MTKDIISTKIKKTLHSINDVISVTIVGSFNNKINLKKIGDIDVVVILEKMTKKKFNECEKKINSLNNFIKKITGKNIYINNTLGPIKYDYTKYTVIHLMIYDKILHKKHVMNSPFTCFDWERSNNYIGMPLKEIYPVGCLQLNDFISSSRTSNNYIQDIKSGSISYGKYYFKNKSFYLKKMKFKLDNVNKYKFAFHVVKNLLLNFYKYQNKKNKLISKPEIKNLFLEITRNRKLYYKFLKIKFKVNREMQNFEEPLKIAIYFLESFNKFIQLIEQRNKIIFIRHNKTKYNDGTFFGQNRDTSNISSNQNRLLTNEKLDICFSSPSLRAIQTARFYLKENKIKKNDNLMEINYGLAEGLNLNEFKIKYPKIIRMWNKELDPKFPSGENNQDVYNRLNIFLSELIKNKNNVNKKILVVTHNVILRNLVGSFLKIKKQNFYKIKILFNENYKFIIFKNKILPNISRKQIDKLMEAKK